jgi:hypothetical protein
MLKTNKTAKNIVKNHILENQISGKVLESTLEYLVDKF